MVLRKVIFFVFFWLILTSPQLSSAACTWNPIFNGKNFQGWDAPKGSWAVKKSTMTTRGGKGSILYSARQVPDNFELNFEWKISPAGNSGVYYGPGEYEYQLVDNRGNPDGKNPLTRAGSLYNFAPATKDVARLAREWNTGKIFRKDTRIRHWLNEEIIVDIDYSLPEWNEARARHKKFGGDVASRGGYIFFQDHGSRVWFRNIRLRELCSKQ